MPKKKKREYRSIDAPFVPSDKIIPSSPGEPIDAVFDVSLCHGHDEILYFVPKFDESLEKSEPEPDMPVLRPAPRSQPPTCSTCNFQFGYGDVRLHQQCHCERRQSFWNTVKVWSIIACAVGGIALFCRLVFPN